MQMVNFFFGHYTDTCAIKIYLIMRSLGKIVVYFHFKSSIFPFLLATNSYSPNLEKSTIYDPMFVFIF